MPVRKKRAEKKASETTLDPETGEAREAADWRLWAQGKTAGSWLCG